MRTRGPATRRTTLLAVAAGVLAASALVARGGPDAPAPVVCASHAVLAPTVLIEPYGTVHVVDEVEAAELARGCAHAGRYELTPDCVLWRTEPVPEPVPGVSLPSC